MNNNKKINGQPAIYHQHSKEGAQSQPRKGYNFICQCLKTREEGKIPGIKKQLSHGNSSSRKINE